MEYKNAISPQCCPEVEEGKTVFLRYKEEPDWSYDDEIDKERPKGYVGMKPTWAVIGLSKKYRCEVWIDALFCPHCGKPVPEIELNPSTKNSKLGNPDDDYCNTCGERNRGCKCPPPWFAWRPVGKKVLLPNKKD